MFALIGALLIGGCATPNTASPVALQNYVERANAWIGRCEKESGDPRRQTDRQSAQECVERARIDVQPLLAKAEGSVRFQRGTRMDLAHFVKDWSDAMDCIATPTPESDCRTTLNATVGEMRSLSPRLDRP